MAAIQGVTRNYYKKFKFVVEIAGVVFAGFQTCGEISVENAKIEHHEGGSLIPNKSPGKVTVADVELTRGATQDKDLWDWMRQAIELGAIVSEDELKRSISIVQQDRAGNEIDRWDLINAWPVKFVASAGWDNDADENLMESITLAYDYPEIGGDAS